MSNDRDLVRIHCRMYGCYAKKDSPHICLKDSITVRKKVLFDAYGEPCIVAVCTTYISEEEMAKIMEETKTAAAKKEEVKKEEENMAELPVYTLPDRWLCKKCREQGVSPSKCRKYFERKLENTYAIINTFDRVVEKDRFTDPDFFNYYDHPEGKHHLECSGQISNPEVVKLVQHILRHHRYGWKPKKWWQFWRKY